MDLVKVLEKEKKVLEKKLLDAFEVVDDLQFELGNIEEELAERTSEEKFHEKITSKEVI